MDITKIISDCTDTVVKDVVSGKFNFDDVSLDEKTLDLMKQDSLLMHYSKTLLATYHEALRKQLAEQGIEI